MSASKVICCIFLASDQLLRVKQLTIGARADLVNNGRFQVDHNATWHVLPSTGLTEEGIECVISTSNGLVRRHLAIRLDTVLQAEELPARISNLNATLSEVKAKN